MAKPKMVPWEVWAKKNGIANTGANRKNYRDQYWLDQRNSGRDLPQSALDYLVKTYPAIPGSMDAAKPNQNPSEPTPAGWNSDGTPAAPAASDTPATPAAPKAPPTNANFDQQIAAINQRITNLPTLYDTKRTDLYSNTREQLLNGGYFDSLATANDATKTSNDQGVSYKFSYGPDGRLYRQAYMTNTNNLAARGMASGSVLESAQRQSRDVIDGQRAQAITNYNTAQNQTFGDQTSEKTGLDTQLTNTKIQYGTWQGDQNAPTPTDTVDPNAAASTNASTTVGTGTTPTDQTGTSTVRARPQILGTGKTKSAAVTAARQKVPGVRLEIRTRGGGKGFVAVRSPKSK